MNRHRIAFVIVAIAALVVAIGRPQPARAEPGAERWLHVRVIEENGGGSTVEVNLPIELVHTAVPLFQDASTRARLDFAEHGFDGRDLKQLLRELAVSPDGEYVTIHDDGDEVRVVRQGRLLLVHVQERDDRGARVEARLPMRVVEALASGEDDALNIAAALEALAEERDGELVTIVDDDGATQVRMWIDSSNQQKSEV